ncbi:hypothetical protein HDV05_005866 [Chytridiales sp. JEL 0842]|nr:hypothetical protein HDV05_005866 [Chytridiales sp. JEL 0842]
MSSTTTDHWNSNTYQTNAGFVPLLTSTILQTLDPQPDDLILDLGCGDGVLTIDLVKQYRVKRVVGVDFSAAMIASAKNKILEYDSSSKSSEDVKLASALSFHVADGQELEGCQELMDIYDHLSQTTYDPQHKDEEGPFTAVFSNAALHWMSKDPEGVIRGVRKMLRKGGRFVAEMGGHMNIATVHGALINALKRRGIDGEKVSPFFFPTDKQYHALLASNGFIQISTTLVPRPTPLPTGLLGWLETFAGPFLDAVSKDDAEKRQKVLDEVVEELRPVLCDYEGNWTLDYVRLRINAIRA